MEPERSAPTNRKAYLSVLFGALGFACAFVSPFPAFVLAVPSVTCGVHARREIADVRGTQSGDLVAIVGLTIGATTLGLVIVSTLLSISLG